MKFAVCFSTSPFDCQSAVRKMVRAMQLGDGQESDSFSMSGGALGYVTSSDRFSAIPLLRRSEHGNVLMVSGVPIDLHGSLDARLQDVVGGDFQAAARTLPSLDGAFAALFWDARNRKLVTVTDSLGLQPLYIARLGDVLLLATELKAFPASGLIGVDMDPAGWGAFVSLGFNIGDHTQLAGVRRAESATVMIYDPIDGDLQSSVHWSLPEPRAKMTLEDVDTDEMMQIMRREIECYASHCPAGTVLLSGGFDSRLILALLNQSKIDCNAFVLTHLNSRAEARFATRIAKRLNCRHIENIVPSWDTYASPAYLRYLTMNEVATPSMRLYVTPHVAAGLRPEMKAVWEGVGPGFAFAPAYPRPGGFTTYLEDRCKGQDTPQWQAAFTVFSDTVGPAMYETFQQLLRREMGKYTDDNFGVGRFQMENQMRRFLALAPLAVYANTVLPFTPGLSKVLWDLAGRIPLSVTAGKKLYLRLLVRHFPEAMAVPICTGGNLVGARSFTPGLWTQEKIDGVRNRCRYYWGRLSKLPVVGPILSQWGLTPEAEFERNQLLDAVVASIDPGHPDLDADAVRAAQQAEPPFTWPERLGRRQLFYWRMWRWVMENRLTTENAGTLLQQELRPKSHIS